MSLLKCKCLSLVCLSLLLKFALARLVVRLILVKLSGGWACEVFHLNLVLGVLFFPCCLPWRMSVCVCVCMFVRVCKYRLLICGAVSVPREFELCGRAANLFTGWVTCLPF